MASFKTENPLMEKPNQTTGIGEIGDIFGSALWPGPQTIIRNWHIKPANCDALTLGRRDPPPGGHKVSLRHGPSGNYVLILDGQVIRKDYEAVMVRTFTISFSLPDRRACTIDCSGTSTIGFNHLLRLDGVEVAELRTVLDPSLGETFPRRAGVADTRVFSADVGKKRVVVYQLFVEPGGASGSDTTLLIERRYSEFVTLDMLIRSATEAHLLSSLPTLPGKVFNPMTDQNSDSFIATRKESLQLYVEQLLQNHKVMHYSDVLCFLGLHPVTGKSLVPQRRGSESDS